MQSIPEGRFPNLDGLWSFEAGSVTELWGLFISVAVLGITIWVAWRQFQIMNRHTELMEAQDKIIQAQLARKVALTLRQPGQTKDDADRITFANLEVRSIGNYFANGFGWEVLVPFRFHQWVVVAGLNHRALPTRHITIGADRYVMVRDQHEGRLFSGGGLEIGELQITHNEPPIDRFRLLWQLRYEDGTTPDEGYAFLDFEHTNDYFYRVTYNHRVTINLSGQ